EHSAMSAVLGAAAAGCRTFTATSAVGLAYMLEAYQNAGALRLPTVLALVNRHAGGLLNIHNDHSDAMLARNAAWIQLHAENAQEAYDNALQAFRVAEDERLRLPVTVCHDGFIVSHTMERLLTLSDAEARSFVGEFIPPVDLLDVDNPHAVGPVVLPDFVPNLYAQIAEAMRWAPAVIEEIGQEYGLLTGRHYGLIDAYRMDDAEVAILAMGSVCGTVRAVVDLLRSRGVAAGMVKLRVFRPFPVEALCRTLLGGKLRALAAIDKTPDLGQGGPLFVETSAALALHIQRNGGSLPMLTNAVMGVGGRDITSADITGVFRQLLDLAGGTQPSSDPVYFMDVGNQGTKTLAGTNGYRNPSQSSRHPLKIVLVARGGQGARTSAYLIAEMMIDLGQYAQASTTYGPERTGAPVRAYAKVSDRPIDDREQIYSPDVVVVFDETLLDVFQADLERLAEDGTLIVNTRRSPHEIRRQIGLTGRHIYTLDATGIALSEFNTNRPNTAMLAAMTEILGLGDRERIKRAFRAKMKRLSEKVLQGNIRAMDRAAREVIREM
ncbi:MAG TPA: 2-oxoacid:acceptor oxidoreductase family protein, partial [Phycisphaerae bacterium]|nr:2-oxoacid:acceptor oxidoreductase family protein [Phycisphaerae bacterium]